MGPVIPAPKLKFDITVPDGILKVTLVLSSVAITETKVLRPPVGVPSGTKPPTLNCVPSADNPLLTRRQHEIDLLVLPLQKHRLNPLIL